MDAAQMGHFEMVRLLLSKSADPKQLRDHPEIAVEDLNMTMQYWIAVAESNPPPSAEDLEHFAKTPPMHLMHVLGS